MPMMYSANIGWNDPILVTRVSDKRFIRIWKSFQLKDKFLEELLRLGSPINWENFLCSESGVSIFSTSFCGENLEFLSLFPVGPHLDKKARELHTASLQSSEGSGGASLLPPPHHTTLKSSQAQNNTISEKFTTEPNAALIVGCFLFTRPTRGPESNKNSFMSELSKSAIQQFCQIILIHRNAKESETRTFLRLTDNTEAR